VTGREVWITGVGILSSLGEGPEAHWDGLVRGQPRTDATTFAPYIVHPLAPVEFDKQIPKKGDQRTMEPWQRIGTYAAGLALESAGVKGNPEILGRMDMIVAAGGGERDVAVDGTILTGLAQAGDPAGFLNERLMSELRPTLFLAQLSNLLAGNISIVHGVTGSSRTFMGEESAGIEAVRVAFERIRAGQSDIALVGGAQNGERKDVLLLFEFAGFTLKGAFAPVWQRGEPGGFALGSMGAFLVLESADHATRRGATPLARLSAVVSDRVRRDPGAVALALERMWHRLPQPPGSRLAVFSGATGVADPTAEERAFLAGHPDAAVRATGTRIGHGLEPQFAMNIALAAIALGRAELFPPDEASGVERPLDGAVERVVVTEVGHWRGEGMALVEAAG
jgi:3-oxoacyl-[acyl-carrier-protein] synthase II